MDFDQFCDEVLSLIEYEETSLLNWGFTDVEIDLDSQLSDLLSKLSASLQATWRKFQDDENLDETDILRNLLERHLIFKNEGLYRSRFAETFRLLLLLRQRFSYDDWATGPRLVADARIQLQRRRYPRRDITYQEFLDSMNDLSLPSEHVETLRLLLQGTDNTYYQWAGFQQRSTYEILKQLNRREQSGVIIGAGTGSGKTKAAYIPALTWLDNHIKKQHRVAIIAIYPRNELLKDQFVEAVRETERLNEQRRAQGKRPIIVGAYYGETPSSTSDQFHLPDDADWPSTFLRCPTCNGTLIWYWEERHEEVYILRCQRCGYATKPDHILVTRKQMKETPPDLLFTTTEMLNRNMSQVDQWPVFGIQQSHPPEMLLLDEVHTYEGISGTNIAYLLRRWRQACGYARNKRTLCIVGLSATLSQATETFAKLIGLPSYRVKYITPRDEELEAEGIEYNTILKGDPSSGVSLLSTSIQTVMLLARSLSTMDEAKHAATYPPKIFAFVNRLDTLNRWYDNQLDAEGNALSQFRDWSGIDLTGEQSRAIKRSGQDWRIAQLIGHKLDEPIQIGRTSSQDQGVVDTAKLVIATSALEVGFNDTRVGAVVQHQSPLSMASFLQRKGRAGRNRRARPWTVVIMSAYGRDRANFQNAEHLFDPLLPPINLPLQNYYVQKIQAAFALMDWLTQQLQPGYPSLNLWRLLYKTKPNHATNAVIELLHELLTDRATRMEYESYLRKALDLEYKEASSTVHNLLWGEPRPILLEVVPTLLRQLESHWQTLALTDNWEIQANQITPPRQPLPEFVPSTLFFDLNLPELALYLGNNNDAMLEPFLQTFEEIVPGRVSKRYLPQGRYGSDGYWIELPDGAECDLTKLAIEFEANQIPVLLQAGEQVYRIRRPFAYRLRNVPSSVSSSSTAWPIWQSVFEPKGLGSGTVESHPIRLAGYSVWHSFVKEIELYTQALSTTITVTRGMVGVEISHWRGGVRINGKRMFVEPEAADPSQLVQAGIGYSMDVDGICIHYEPLDHGILRQSSEWEDVLRSARPYFYSYLLQHDALLTQTHTLNTFEIEWISRVVVAGLIASAIGKRQSLSEASAYVQKNFMDVIEQMLDVIFQANNVDETPERGRVAEAVKENLQKLDVKRTVLAHLDVLWDAYPAGMSEWLELQYASSLACTFFTALTTLVPDINPIDLSLDIKFEHQRIWITETTPGGIGLIARIAEAMAHYPRRLELQLQDTVHHCDREQRATALNTVMQSLIQNPNNPLDEAFKTIREERDFVSVSAAKQQLNDALFSEHLSPTRELVVTLNARMLRPNSSEQTDQLTHELMTIWREEEARLGISIDARIFSVAALSIDSIRQHLDAILSRWGNTEGIADYQRVNLIDSMIWISCHDSCEECISVRSRYQELVKPSRSILKALMPHLDYTVTYGTNEWQAQLIEMLQLRYECALRCQHDELAEAKLAILWMLTQQVEVGVQMFYPTLERIERNGEYWYLHVILREMVGV